jgi:hypothetical protein
LPGRKLLLPALLAVFAGFHLVTAKDTEPFVNGDETRHVVTGVFFRDLILDGGFLHPREYAERYYAQYPALGLLVWPPGFYAAEGVVMLVTGPSYAAARGLVLAYFLLGTTYLFRLVASTHGPATAVVACLVAGFARIVYPDATQVMLEVPTLACVLGCLFHLERFLASTRRRDLVWLGFWTFAAAVHRYDAIFLLPLFGLRLALDRKLGFVLRKDVLVTAGVVALFAAPAYLLAAKEIGDTQASAAGSGTNPAVSTGFLNPWNWLYYPNVVWFQVGRVAAVLAGAGILLSFAPGRHALSRPYWALALAVYFTFTPFAELEPRHAIYWIPAVAVFAADAALWPARQIRSRAGIVAAMLLAGVLIYECAYWTLRQPANWVKGYEPVAVYCLDRCGDNPVILFDGLFDGNFVYQVRSHDPERKAWVLRGDKLLYAVKSDPHAGYVEWANTDEEILKLIEDADPAFVVVEEPFAKYQDKLPGAVKLRQVLAAHPDRFRREEVFPVLNGNQEYLDGVSLVVYRKLHRNPNRPARLGVKMLWQGREVGVEINR